MKKSNMDMLIMELNGRVIVRCLVAMAKIIGCLLPFKNGSSLFFFFPFLHVGGAERVHADIVNCFSDLRPWVFFTKRSDSSKFRTLFSAKTKLLNIWCLLKYGYPFSVGIMAGFVNRHKNPVVFGCNSLFFYLLIPYLRPDVRRIDLLHAFGGGSENFSLPVVDKLDSRVVINAKTMDDVKDQYLCHGVNSSLLGRIVLIENRVSVPERCPERSTRDVLKVVFVGRCSPEKRVYLVGKAATHCREKRIPAEFILVGDVGDAVEVIDRKNCLLKGEIADVAELEIIYAEADVLVLTSSREGFPLVVMEAMAHGVVPVCTDVGGISLHIRNGINGLLVENDAEEKIVEELVATINLLCDDREFLRRLSRAAYEYARTSFGSNGFCNDYKKLILNQ